MSIWKKDIRSELSRVIDRKSPLTAGQICDIELGLFLWEQISPGKDCSFFWVVLTGYQFATVTQNWTDELRKSTAVARYYLRYYKSRRLWLKCLDDYIKVPERLRLYDISEVGLLTRKQPSICADRPKFYERALQVCPPFTRKERKWAKPGRVYFWTDKSVDDVDLPPEWVEDVENSSDNKKRQVLPKTRWTLEAKTKRTPLKVSLKELLETARWMDEKLASPEWYGLMERIHLETFDQEQLKADTMLTLDGVCHLVGMLSSGKSTLMKILAVWASRRNLHVTIVVDNVASVLNIVSLISRLGLKAAPILGVSNRPGHLEKLHMLTGGDNLLDLMEGDEFEWLSTVCPLNGLRHDTTRNKPFSPGKEPCTQLYLEQPAQGKQKKQEAYFCPAYHCCPVHQTTRDLPEASIWVATPASLIHTRVPIQLKQEKMRMWELVYLRSDIIVFDEADRIQVLLDGYFAPTQVLADGTSGSWLNKLGERVSASFFGQGRRQLLEPSVTKWHAAYNNIQKTVDLIYTTLLRNTDIRRWVGRNYFTTWGLMDRLAANMAEENPDIDRKEIMDSLEQFRSDPLADDKSHMLVEAASYLMFLPEPEMGHAKIRSWFKEMGHDAICTMDNIERIAFIVIMAVLEASLRVMINEWETAIEHYQLDGDGLDFFRNQLGDYLPVLPEAPTGNIFGFQYMESGDGGPGLVRVFRYMGVGRWLLLRFSDLLVDAEGVYGPHTLLLSGTSWAPGSPAYHIAIPPMGVLKSPDTELKAIQESEIFFSPAWQEDGKPVTVSGRREQERENSLRSLLRYLTAPGPDGLCLLKRELSLLEPKRKRLLMLVGSYEETEIVKDFFKHRPGWQDDDVYRLVRDEEDIDDEGGAIQRGRVDQFAGTRAKILVAPMMAIERGHNILNEMDVAAFGSAYFLIRPMPTPHDMNNHTLFINRWALEHCQDIKWLTKESTPKDFGELGVYFRKEATRRWQARLSNERLQSGLPAWHPAERYALYWTQLVMIWQVIGRLIRGGSKARVHFCDAAFAPRSAAGTSKDDETNSMLLGMRSVLQEYMIGSGSQKISLKDSQLAVALYGPLAKALENIKGLETIV